MLAISRFYSGLSEGLLAVREHYIACGNSNIKKLIHGEKFMVPCYINKL